MRGARCWPARIPHLSYLTSHIPHPSSVHNLIVARPAFEGEGEVAEQSPAVGGPLAVLLVPDLRPLAHLLGAVPLPPADLHDRRHFVYGGQRAAFVGHFRHDLLDVDLAVDLHWTELVVLTGDVYLGQPAL